MVFTHLHLSVPSYLHTYPDPSPFHLSLENIILIDNNTIKIRRQNQTKHFGKDKANEQGKTAQEKAEESGKDTEACLLFHILRNPLKPRNPRQLYIYKGHIG